jgi:tRNA dimethylallyltransferase
MKRKFLIICGPTATGKTALALSLAKRCNAELVSADSRQVYKGMDIGTGKDLPGNARFKILDLGFKNRKIGHYEVGTTKIWGYDLVEPNEEFSVASYVEIVSEIIENIWKRGKFPILVGGTGFYIKGVVDGIGTSRIPKNEVLRRKLEQKSPGELFEMLVRISPLKAKGMNASDRKNPRRLIRAIEIARYKRGGSGNLMMGDSTRPQTIKADKTDVLFIGLTAPKAYLNERIERRVEKRLNQGIEKEIADLLEAGVSWNNQSMQSLGYKQWIHYSFFLVSNSSDFAPGGVFAGQRDKVMLRNQVVKEWKRAEVQYAKRQMTWFKKDKRIRWFNITKRGWKKEVENAVCKWHNNDIKYQNVVNS